MQLLPHVSSGHMERWLMVNGHKEGEVAHLASFVKGLLQHSHGLQINHLRQ